MVCGVSVGEIDNHLRWGLFFRMCEVVEFIKFNDLNCVLIDGTGFAIHVFVVFLVFHERRNQQ